MAAQHGDRDLDGVLFDVDGTLVDTTYLHAVTWWEALRQADHTVPMARVHHAIGMGSDRILEALLGPERDPAADAELAAAHSALYSVYWERLCPLPGATDLLRAWAADADESKPAPDILGVALDRAGLPAERVILVGDSAWDVQAATRISVPCIGLTCGGTSAEELTRAGAVAIFTDPADLLARWDESPLKGS